MLQNKTVLRLRKIFIETREISFATMKPEMEALYHDHS